MIDFRLLAAAAAGVTSLSVAGCATAGGDMQVADADAGGAATDIICRRVHEVGSRLSSRQCMTRAEWDAQAEQAREAMERNNERGVGSAGGPVMGPGR